MFVGTVKRPEPLKWCEQRELEQVVNVMAQK